MRGRADTRTRSCTIVCLALPLRSCSAIQWQLPPVAADTALSIVPASPCRSSRRRETGPGRGRRPPDAAADPGASENVARFSRTTVARTRRAPRAPGKAAATSRGRERRPASLRRRRPARSAPLDTSDRCEARSPNARRLSNTHCIVAAGQADEQIVHHRPVVPQRFTVTIGIGRIARGVGDRRGERAPASAAEETSERRTTAPPRSTAARAIRSPRTSTPCDSSAGDRIARERARRAHFPAALLDVRARRLGVHLVAAARAGSTIAAIDGIGPEHLREHAHERRRRGFSRRLVQRRHGQRLPQPLAERVALP